MVAPEVHSVQVAQGGVLSPGLQHAVVQQAAGHALQPHQVLTGSPTLAGIEDDEEPMHPLLAVLLIYGILFMIIGAQAALVMWRKRHKKSYELVTLVGLWLMPAIFCVQLKFWRFLFIWAVYSIVTIYLISMCMRKKMEHSTPRLVYSWFLAAYRISLCIGVAGYAMVLAEMLGMGPLLNLLFPKGTSVVVVWYGLYFGVLGRDCAEVAADRIAATVGSAGRRLLNTANSCGICGNEMHDYSHLGEQPADTVEPVVQLSCKHCFHNLCIRGWTMVGKKDTCPVCMEKVDLKELYSDRPWETRNLTWIQMLDTVRYLVVWNPLILMILSVLLHFMPHSHHHHHHPPYPPGTLLHPPGALGHLSPHVVMHSPPPPLLAVQPH